MKSEMAAIGRRTLSVRSNAAVAVAMYRIPAHTNLVDLEDVSLPKSPRSIIAVDRPRLAASNADPAPVAPPPTTSTSNASPDLRRFSCSERLGRMIDGLLLLFFGVSLLFVGIVVVVVVVVVEDESLTKCLLMERS